MTVESIPFNLAEIRCETRINASPERVWDTLTGDASSWWHAAYYTNPLGPEKGGYHIEPKLGGRMFEDWGDGQGLIWAQVIGVERNKFLQLLGDSTAEWGGPSRNCMTIKLEEDEDATILRFHCSFFGRVSEATAKSLDTGWLFLFDECLKRYVETGSLEGVPEVPAC